MRTIAGVVRRCVDGGIIGPPPRTAGTTRLYLSGREAQAVADLFAGTVLDARVVAGGIGAASALKMAYASWTKGGSALLLAARAAARAHGVEQLLLDEWRLSLPDLPSGRSEPPAAASKGWRWVGEMDEIAGTFAAAGLPVGFHRAAGATYERSRRAAAADADGQLDAVLSALLEAPDAAPPGR